MSKDTLEAIRFDKENVTLDILDQLLLPYESRYINIKSIQDAFEAIKSMQVRGAPAIAIVGAFAITVDTHLYLKSGETSKTIADLLNSIDYLVTSRPTAVNLANACNEIKALLISHFEKSDVVTEKVWKLLFDYSVSLHEDDLRNNFKIGENGLRFISETLKAQNFKGPFSIVTVCNTGSLATSGHGTALGVIRTVHAQLSKSVSNEEFWFEHVYPLETRPYNQGAKLTTYELHYEKIPFTMICDNMVTSLISTLHKKKNIKGSAAPVKFIITGADRVVKNGDSANKIGTYQLAAIADFFNSTFTKEEDKIKFMVAAPNTTIDLKTETGDEIVIEERPAHELTSLKGPVLREDGSVGEKMTVGIATPGIQVWNPAFDVAPYQLIDCIVTEDEPFKKVDGKFSF
ncbi:putative methylthioribose-1-phosphate isomerase [Clavispora lusitaniae]|uniref:Methylthioribose-1-phosphate isomerase n=1 Tax=Clavispora lusitaniae TaxID=36911 RepID=A0AA91T2H9_CLALS|nr:putative methylthioribose-1-phosphate isomerase [Clavispora lusitaniae]